jgi:hypothetical protein
MSKYLEAARFGGEGVGNRTEDGELEDFPYGTPLAQDNDDEEDEDEEDEEDEEEDDEDLDELDDEDLEDDLDDILENINNTNCEDDGIDQIDNLGLDFTEDDPLGSETGVSDLDDDDPGDLD